MMSKPAKSQAHFLRYPLLSATHTRYEPPDASQKIKLGAMPGLVAPYLLSLCKAVQNSDFSFGVVSRSGAQSSTFQLDAAKLIYSIVEYSPASESVALQFLSQFQKIWI